MTVARIKRTLEMVVFALVFAALGIFIAAALCGAQTLGDVVRMIGG